MRSISKILIANRGEIAVRIIRTCREIGIATVAVFSDADRRAPHVRLADEAYRLGPAPASESYLSVERILQIASECGCDAVHPGYGFRSESAGFATACRDAGLTFIGPPPSVLEAVGDKTTARSLLSEAGVPMAPGSDGAVNGAAEARAIAEEVGYPVIIKAAAGGGGKGMRLVRDAAELAGAIDMSQSEASSAFGDGRVFVEKYLENARHVEVQVLADEHGHVVHLFERECTIQRRHQKIIEEAPSVILDDELRRAMGATAVAAARACGYVNAGTVEFLVDGERNYYFMEINARLQVEHPVTEMITGLDLVGEQIRIARGELLGYEQADVRRSGHAIECRIYAEDPAADFLPDPGVLLRYAPPSGPGIRVDDGICEGGEIVIHYDPLISKLIVWAPDRPAAIARTLRALDEYEIAGVRTTIPFCRFVLSHPAFKEGTISTHFVDQHLDPGALAGRSPSAARIAAVSAGLFKAYRLSSDSAPKVEGSRWQSRREM